jgi:Domain of unknown function (DUF4431)
MPKAVVFLVFFVTSSFGQNCLKYGAVTDLAGTLLLRDEAGYNQFIVLKPLRAVCMVADPKDVTDRADPYNRMRSGITEFQVVPYGSDPASDASLRDRLKRLIGQRVVIKIDLYPATTGYDRTNVVARVHAVDAVDASGRNALLAPAVANKIKDIAAYDLTINAGQRLMIEAHESESATPLIPSDQYVTHWMSGGEVLYVDCRDGYERSLISSTEKDGGLCSTGRALCRIRLPEETCTPQAAVHQEALTRSAPSLSPEGQ